MTDITSARRGARSPSTDGAGGDYDDTAVGREVPFGLRLAALARWVARGARKIASWRAEDWAMRQQGFIGAVLLAALLAFELFNFDTTRYALGSLFGGTSFLSFPWATILALAFCGIDFAGLARLFLQAGEAEHGATRRPEVIYLWGAWFLAAGMNAAMTWWAVSLSLLQHDFGNEVLTHAQILRYVPIFIAVLVWLTRILLIGAFSIASDSFLRTWQTARGVTAQAGQRRPAAAPVAVPAGSNGRRGPVPSSLARMLGEPSRPSAARPVEDSAEAEAGALDGEPEVVSSQPPARPATRPAAKGPVSTARPGPHGGTPAPKPAHAAFTPRPLPVAVPVPPPVARPGNGNGNGRGQAEGAIDEDELE